MVRERRRGQDQPHRNSSAARAGKYQESVTMDNDKIVPAGVFVWLGKEVDTLFVVALLSIMGFSVHDTIVVFDRIRENLKHKILPI